MGLNQQKRKFPEPEGAEEIKKPLTNITPGAVRDTWAGKDTQSKDQISPKGREINKQ